MREHQHQTPHTLMYFVVHVPAAPQAARTCVSLAEQQHGPCGGLLHAQVKAVLLSAPVFAVSAACMCCPPRRGHLE